MLRLFGVLKCPVKYAVLSSATGKLNALLDIRNRKERVSSEVLKQYIRTEVMPILRATSLDRRHDSAQMRRFLSQLLRDSAFAAFLLRARPNDAYVTALVNCIKHDHERMQFVHKMTSSQASRVIEHLCRVGVKDSNVYAPLIARLDFNVLKEVARAMFALAEEGLYHEVVALIVPLYCGERWVPLCDGGEKWTPGSVNKNCNLFDAVRVLRVLSKAVRGVVEQRRFDKTKATAYPLPTESIQRLRTNLTLFIIENSGVLRGSHWINFTRAMVHFPHEFKAMKGLGPHISALKAVDVLNLPHRVARRQLSDTIDTDDMAAYGMQRIFARVEQQENSLQSKRPGVVFDEKGNKTLFDVPSIDLTKLLSIIDEVPFPKSVKQRRLKLVIDAIVNDMDKLHITDLVRFLQSLRRIEGSAVFGSSLDAAVAAVSKLLERATEKNTAVYVPYERLVQLATLLTAFRVKNCKGFLSYLSHCVSMLPFIGVEDAVSFMNALALFAESDVVGVCSRIGGQIFEKIGLGHEEDSPTLLLSHPLQSAKLLRSMVLLNTTPSLSAFTRLFGQGEEELQASPALLAAGASVLFDVSRSLYHFYRMKLVDSTLEEKLWKRGIVGALLPLLTQLTLNLHEELLTAPKNMQQKSYVPLAWRSTIEAVFVWVDVNLDTVSLAKMQQRIEEVYPFLRKIATLAVGIAAAQFQEIKQNPAADLIVFSNNAVLHLVYFLLMLEYLLYHGNWQAEISPKSSSTNDLREMMNVIKEDYNKFLVSPVCQDRNGNDVTAISLFNCLFPTRGEEDNFHSFFDHKSILEVTTNLPFAVSLVVSPGPINEIFCDRAVTVMILRQ